MNENLVVTDKLGEVIFRSPKIDRKGSKELTGYPSVDMPHQKYYANKEVIVPDKTIYEVLVDNNADNLDTLAFTVPSRNSEITYREFIDLIDSMSRGMKKLGLKENDKIVCLAKNTPESVALTFAASRQGLELHFIDPQNSEKERNRMIEESFAGTIFVTEDYLNTVEKLSDKNIVVMPKLDTNIVVTDEYINFNDFISADVTLDKPVSLYKNKSSYIMYTGGTTGPSKGVGLTDFNFVDKYYRTMNSNWKYGRNRTMLSCLPEYIAYGLSEAIVSPLLAGETLYQVDCLDIMNYSKHILDSKANDIACSPVHMQFLINSPLITDDTDLSFIEMILCGGDGMTETADKLTVEFLKKHGSVNSFGQGCGFTEGTGAFCWGTGDANGPGYMGIPLNGYVSAVFDPVTGEELPYDTMGEWAVKSDSIMNGYYGSTSEKNKGTLIKHEDGDVWLHTGDMLMITADGKQKMGGRKQRTFNYMGMNIYPMAIESVLSNHPAIKKCIASGIKNNIPHQIAITEQKVPVVNIELNEGYENQEESIVDDLNNIVNSELPEYIDIIAYIFREQIPYTDRGKTNYHLLETEGLSPKGKCKVLINKNPYL